MVGKKTKPVDKKLHLQGLRAIAIGSVLLFHFYPEWFPNGYLGVDQFFFLSGYLMAMMMCRYKEHSLFNCFDFLYRRVKRIVPMYYLSTFIILLSLYFAPISAVPTNLASSLPALLFGTNLIRPTGLEGYEEKLGVAVDMFTHTWSLSLEMQFYLLFPLIFITTHPRNGKPRDFLLYFYAIASTFFYFLIDDFLSFNCVASRIWQFILGVLVYDLSVRKKIDQKDPDLESLLIAEETEGDEVSTPNLLVQMCLILSFSLLLFPHLIDADYARTTVTLLTAVVVHIGERNWLLENKLAVYVGEISYGWYLVHWPIVAHLKLNGLNSYYFLSLGLGISFLISVAIHHIYERKYIFWQKGAIAGTLLILLLANGVALELIYEISPDDQAVEIKVDQNQTTQKEAANATIYSRSYYFESDLLDVGPLGYENITNEEKAKLNDGFDAGDGSRLHATERQYHCPNLAPANQHEMRCTISNTNSTGKTLLVIGNSYALNTITVINQECQSKFGQVILSTTPSCEPLFETITTVYNCVAYGSFFLDVVEKIKPDVLIIVARAFQLAEIYQDGTTPFNDFHFKTATSRLQQFEKNVKERIYLMDGFPEPKKTMSVHLNKHLREGANFTDAADIIDLNPSILIAKQRISRLAEGCKKCRVYDYTSRFYFDGQYKPYDPKHFVAYFTSGIHLTPAGLERMRPLFRDMCSRSLEKDL